METAVSHSAPAHFKKKGKKKSSEVLDAVHREKSSEILAQLHRSFSATEVAKAEHAVVDSTWFNSVINICIALNALQLGIEADRPELETAWLVLENIFTGAFFLEMVIKVCVLKFEYLEEKANWLDALLTIFGVLDCWILALVPGDSVDLQSMSILRVLRLARLGRVLRLARRVKQIVLVMSGVMQALKTTFWVFLLLIFVIYVCAIFCTEYIGRADVDIYPGYAKEEALIDEQEIMMNFNPYLAFGDMKSSMLTLFNIAIGGEWAEVVRPLAVKQPWLVLVFALYNMLMAFGLMNVMMAIIVDSVIDESKKLDKEMQELHKAKQRKLLQEIEEFFDSLDTNNDSELDADELDFGFGNAHFQHLLKQTDLPAGWTAKELLHMLDDSGDGVLQKSEFMSSFFRLMDSNDFQGICIMQAGINQIKNMVRRTHDKLDIEIDEVNSMLRDLHTVGIGGKSKDLHAYKFDWERQFSGSQKSDNSHCDHKETLHCQPQEQSVALTRAMEDPQTPKKALLSAATRDLIMSSREQDVADYGGAPLIDTSKNCASADEARDKIHDDLERNRHKEQGITQNDTGPSPAPVKVSLGNQPDCKASDCPSHTKHDNQGDVSQGFMQDPLETQEPRADMKRVPFKAISDLLDDSFLAMKDALCRELAKLMQAEVISEISRTGEAAIGTDAIASVKCGNLEDGQEGKLCVEQQPQVSSSVSAEANASSCVRDPVEDVKQAIVLHSCQSVDHISTHAKRECSWQELDVQPILTCTSSRLPKHTNNGSAPIIEGEAVCAASVNDGSHVHLELIPDCNVNSRNAGNRAEVCVDTAVEDTDKLGFEIHAATLQEHANIGSFPTTEEVMATAVSRNEVSHVRLEWIPDCDLHSTGIAVEDGDKLGFVDVAVEDGEKLGFELHWCPNQLPLVGLVAPGSASDLCGVLQGDRLMQCNGISLADKCRHDVLAQLKQRPLLLRLQRNPCRG